MDTYTLIYRYGQVALFEIITIWYLTRILKRKNLVSVDIKKNKEKAINIILKILFGICIIYVHVQTIIPHFKDIPYIVDGEYEIVRGTAVSSDTGKTNVDWHFRYFSVQEGNQTIYVEARTKRVHVGDYIEVLYLPNSHLGTVIRRTESKE